MNWTNSELLHIIPHQSSVHGDLTKVRNKGNIPFVCCCCGGQYAPKFCESIMSDTTKLYCKLCFMIQYYKPKYSKMMTICESSLTQLDIIRKTVDYIISHKTHPLLPNIDADAKQLKETPTHFYKNIDHSSETKKIFFTNKINIGEIIFTHIATPQTSSDFSDFVMDTSRNTVACADTTKINIVDRFPRWLDRINEQTTSDIFTEQLKMNQSL